MNPQIFRAYDVRGVADRDLTDEVAGDLGRAYGTLIRRDGGRRVALGRDCRLHGPRLHAAFLAGLLSTGLEVVDVGVVASPLLYFTVFHLDLDGGVEVTGSHNPAEYNGFKMMRGKASLHGEQILALRALIEARDFETGEGTVTEHAIVPDYIGHVAGHLRFGRRPLKVVIDGGNGTGGPVALELYKRLGVDVVPMYVEMDGRFPNHHPDPTVAENLEGLIWRVRQERADLGIAFDGDADRIGVVDEAGDILWGDRLMILLAREILKERPGAAIVSEVKCSKTLFDDIAARGGRPVMSAVGHSIIKERMKAEEALLAGEMSGHIFFAHRWFGFDDAIYAGARLLEILSEVEEPLSSLLADVPTTHFTPEIRLDCPDEDKFRVVEEATAHFRADPEAKGVVDIDGARIDFGFGWGLVRASNTQPVIVMRAEADTPEHLALIRSRIEGFVAARRGA